MIKTFSSFGDQAKTIVQYKINGKNKLYYILR